MAINFAADMESCLIAKHQAAVQWFRHIHFYWQGLVFGICNSRLPFRTDFLALALNVASTCRNASSLTRGRPPLVFLQMHPWLSQLSDDICIGALMFSDSPQNTDA
jgi:hypothetical protein